MKRILLAVLALLVIAALVAAWLFMGSATGFSEKRKYLYISSDAPTREAVLDSLQKNDLINRPGLFSWLAGRMGYWENIRPGRYEVFKGTSLLNLVRRLRNGQQDPVNLTITKLRTRQDLARLIGRRFECDSAEVINYLNSNDSLAKLDITPELVMTVVLPDTYTYFWNTSPGEILERLSAESKKYWTKERQAQAQARGLSPEQAYILASIVEEETNAQAEKGNVASVYLNRIRLGMPLQADPTVKFALQDFSLKRIYQKHLAVESPYNTYRVQGLPPGPICTPSKKTLDAVLEAPTTDYIYFVASPKFDGTHVFTTDYNDHLKHARVYQQALNERFGGGKP
ncbi:MAG TPA: endolytic transglycosylase MltG [Chitinophagaceae bacterium]|jgi:UPF0755 protein|nr:endolytic transglycosylase MltG [Chitinophagaceae bacterium]